jgi:hypothetical protein|tara:strand:- start:39 stop:410 length:372 start_codon:yes stop_codon:yes gene_type:complete
MSHYAKVENGVVTKVIVAEADFFDTFVDTVPGEWIQTSYNTRGGIHYKPNTDDPSEDQSKALRKNYAGIGFVYDSARDAFMIEQPYPSWTLNESTCWYEPPVAYPESGPCEWDEENQQWVEIE